MTKYLLFFLMASIQVVGQDISAQRDFILQNGDTIYGEVMYAEGNLPFKYCDFKATGQSEYEKKYPKDIDGYFDAENGLFTVEKSILGDFRGVKVFMEVLIKGDINFYKYRGKYVLSYPKKALFIELIPNYDGGNSITDKELLAVVQSLFAKIGLEVNSLKSISYNDASMIEKLSKLFRENGLSVSFTKKVTKKLLFNFSANVEYATSSMSVLAFDEPSKFLSKNQVPVNFISAGIDVEYVFPGFSKLIFFNTSLSFFSKDITYTASHSENRVDYLSDFYLNYQGLSLGYGVNFFQEQVLFPMQLRINFFRNFIIRSSQEVIMDTYYRDVIETTFTNSDGVKKSDAGLRFEIQMNPFPRLQEKVFFGISYTYLRSRDNFYEEGVYDTRESVLGGKLIYKFQ